MQTTWTTSATEGKFQLLRYWEQDLEVSSKNHLAKCSSGTAFPFPIMLRDGAEPSSFQVLANHLPLLYHSILWQMFYFALPPPLPTSNKFPLFHREHRIIDFQELMIYAKQTSACHWKSYQKTWKMPCTCQVVAEICLNVLSFWHQGWP